MTLLAVRGALVDFSDDPRTGGASAVRHIEDGLLVIRDGRIERVGAAADLLPALPAEVPVADHRGCLVLPGFIDAHVHFPQIDVIASHGKQLLDWLETYTFPAEARFADAAYSRATAAFFLDRLLAAGTTSALVYPTVHAQSVDALFEAALERGMRIVSGKVMMDRNCPEFLRDTAASSYEDSAALIERWRGRGRLDYAVTPRFAATSTPEQLRFAARLLDEYPGTRLQTHIAENAAEIRWIADLFPDSRDYLGVYEDFGLVRPGTYYGHCIHFDAPTWARFAAAGATAVHCPTSNLFLGSGLFDLGAARTAGARVALATDVGGGTSLSMLATMAEAYKVAQMRQVPFDAYDAFYLATLGGARSLDLDAEIGSFVPGKEADWVVLDPAATPVLARRSGQAGSLAERLFLLMILGDDRVVVETGVAGRRVPSAG
jgi:guanine deaminase